MRRFSDIAAADLAELIRAKSDFEIEISEDVAGFDSDNDFSKPKEIPPTPVILTKEGLAEVMVHGGRTLEGLFTQFVVFTYAYGGRIFYSKLSSGDYLASVQWNDA